MDRSRKGGVEEGGERRGEEERKDQERKLETLGTPRVKFCSLSIITSPS